MKRLRVLVAEDESIIRLDLVGLLEKAGFEVCAQARDAKEAVVMASVAEPDVAILDVKMPRGGGIEAARRIIADRAIPIVILTAYGQERLVERALDAGVFAYLTKPYREQDLIPAIRAAVARHGDRARRVNVDVPSNGPGVWPLAIERRSDGSVDVQLHG